MITRPSHAIFAIFAFTLAFAFIPPLHGQVPYSAAAWQQEIAAGYLPYRRLVLEDFPIDDRSHREHGIYTAGFFHYAYKHRCKVENSRVVALVTEWVVRSGFDRNNSSRKNWFRGAGRFLTHEQGHLDINELHSRHLGNILLNDLPVGEGATCQEAATDLGNKLQALADQSSTDAQAEQDRYDKETGHGTNILKQQEATAAIEARLRKAGITCAND